MSSPQGDKTMKIYRTVFCEWGCEPVVLGDWDKKEDAIKEIQADAMGFMNGAKKVQQIAKWVYRIVFLTGEDNLYGWKVLTIKK